MRGLLVQLFTLRFGDNARSFQAPGEFADAAHLLPVVPGRGKAFVDVVLDRAAIGIHPVVDAGFTWCFEGGIHLRPHVRRDAMIRVIRNAVIVAVLFEVQRGAAPDDFDGEAAGITDEVVPRARLWTRNQAT